MSPSRKRAVPPPPPERRGELLRWPDVELDDAELVRRCADGDRWARAALYHRHAGHVANLALRLLRNREDANDVLQDTFVTAFESMTKMREPERVRSWLRTLAVRHAQRRFRRRRLRRLLGFVTPAVPLEELALEEASQEAVAELHRIDAALQRISDRARNAWTLHVLEGETLVDVAVMCGASLATIKRDVAAAQDAIRSACDETEGSSC